MATAKKKTNKKPGPKPKLKDRERAKVRNITASDVEWRWVTERASERGVSASAVVRELIRREMGASRGL